MLNVDEWALARAFHSRDRVEGLTHNFYRYPARFSPEFVRQVITDLSGPGDLILDPFMGGGTTIVEALASGRRAIGIDINGLAHFVTRVKTTPLSNRDAMALRKWALCLQNRLGPPDDMPDAAADPRTRNLPEGILRFFKVVVQSVDWLRFPRQRRFARCALLRVGQWALDNQQSLPTTADVYGRLRKEIEDMLEGLAEFVNAARRAGIYKNKITASRALIQASATEPFAQQVIRVHGEMPKLVLTSPPYPGVHVLYHRWQVSGRRETPAPYWLADLRDGHGASYYTMGSRSPLGMQNYFATLLEGFENLRTVLSPETTVVQLVAFSQTETQLPLYLEVLASAGYQELRLPSILSGGNHIRTVPNRKWYTNRQGNDDASHEVLLVHRVRG